MHVMYEFYDMPDTYGTSWAQGNCIYAAHGACCSVIWYM